MSVSSTHQDVDRTVIAQGLWGREAVRPATSADVVDQVSPRFVLEPASPEVLCEMLRWANADRVRLVVRGGGTAQSWASLATRVDGVLSLGRMNTAIEHCAGDLTTTMLPACHCPRRMP